MTIWDILLFIMILILISELSIYKSWTYKLNDLLGKLIDELAENIEENKAHGDKKDIGDDLQ